MENKNLLYTVINEINNLISKNPDVNPENVSLKLTELLTENEIDIVKKDFQEERLGLKETLEKNNASINHIPETVISGILLGGKTNVDKYISGERKQIGDYAFETINLSSFMPKNNPNIISLISNNKELQNKLKNIQINEERLITANSKEDSLDNKKEKLTKELSKNKIKL